MRVINISKRTIPTNIQKMLEQLCHKYATPFSIVIYDNKDKKYRNLKEKGAAEENIVFFFKYEDAEKLYYDEDFHKETIGAIEKIILTDEDRLSDDAKVLLSFLRKKCKNVGFAVGQGLERALDEKNIVRYDAVEDKPIIIRFSINEIEDMTKNEDWNELVKLYNV